MNTISMFLFWCNIIQWSGQPWYFSVFNASLLSNSELVKRVKVGGSLHYGRNGLQFGILHYPDHHSMSLTIFGFQQQFKLVASDYPSISYVLVLNNCYVRSLWKWVTCMLCLLPTLPTMLVAIYSRVGCKRQRYYTYHIENNHTAYMSAGDQLCVYQKLPNRNWCYHRQGIQPSSVLKIKMVQPSSTQYLSFAIITSYGNQIIPEKHENNLEIKILKSRCSPGGLCRL